jgi:hypothetical protein
VLADVAQTQGQELIELGLLVVQDPQCRIAGARDLPRRRVQVEHLAAAGRMNRTVSCQQCDDVIGAYEPMTVFNDKQARGTSRATEQAAGGLVGQCCHHVCYPRIDGNDPDCEWP